MARTALLGIALGAAFFVASWVLAPGEPAIGATPAAAPEASHSVTDAVNGFEQMVAISDASAPHASYGF